VSDEGASEGTRICKIFIYIFFTIGPTAECTRNIHFVVVTYLVFTIQLSFTISAVNMAAPVTTSAEE
jgi:hypothetical protein